jgi:SAM-dependent methyltransferase
MNAPIKDIPPAASITHQHLAAVISTLLGNSSHEPAGDTVYILDLGCGDGALMCHYLDSLPVLQPRYRFHVAGLDVADAGQQQAGFMAKTLDLLTAKHPRTDWKQRLSLVMTEDKWPYADATFDFITSNQVMEHVVDHAMVFREIHRCLRPGGVAIHLFPVREVLWEGHALMPLVHRSRSVTQRARLMYLFAQLGFTRHYYRERERRGWTSLREFSRVFAGVLEADTNYQTQRRLAEITVCAGLRCSFEYTKDFYIAKFRSLMGRRSYRYRHMGALENVALWVCRRISSVTLVQRKPRHRAP